MNEILNNLYGHDINFDGVVFLDDILRKDFVKARVFIYSLIEEQLKIILNLDELSLENFPNNRGLFSGFDENIFFSKTNGIWNDNYHNIPLEAWLYLKEYIPLNSIIIGYEMPIWLKNNLIKYDYKYVNIRLSPIRFCRDLFFLIESNLINENILEKYSVKNNEIRVESGLIRAKVRHNTKGERITEGCVFVGQTSNDASIVGENGEFLTLNNFRNKVYEISKRKKIFYKKHPYSESYKDEVRIIEEITGYRPEIIDDNIYELLAGNNNLEFCSISSGTLQEANFFNKKTIFLYKPICNLNDNNILHCYAMDFTSLALWEDIITGKNKQLRMNNPIDRNYMRELHGSWWGYDKFLIDNDSFYNIFFRNDTKNMKIFVRLVKLIKKIFRL